MPTDASNLQQEWARLLVEELTRCGVDTFFVAPGSRSTPLMVAVARHPAARRVGHFDERGAAFAALGYGRATGGPAALVTTSGTAVANAHPAVVEASAGGVPMLLLTADRPPEKRDTGANQTIDQVKLFGGYVRWQFDLPVPTPAIAPEMVLTTADQAVGFARRSPAGPVHLNCMFRKPLAPQTDGREAAGALAGPEPWATSEHPYTARSYSEPGVEQADLDALADRLRHETRGLVVAGRLDGDAGAQAARRLADALGWPLLPDVTSRLRFSDEAISCADQVLASEGFRKENSAGAVVHVGGRIVSKRLRLFLKACCPSPCVVARPDPRRLDPDHRVTHQFETSVAAFAGGLAARLEAPAEARAEASAWRRRWQAADAAAARALDAFAEAAGAVSEPLVARLLSQHLPEDGALVLGSSMPVRDVNRYAAPTAGAPVPVFANRGASGIDGTVATAAGVHEGLRRADGTARPVTLLLGDLALLHDLNALALLRERFVVAVVVNNGGGGIFHFLPIAEHADVFEPHFTTPHDFSFEQAAGMFGLPYFQPASPAGFAETYQAAAARGGPALIEVRTDRAENRRLHHRLEERIAAAVAEATAEAEG